MNGEKLLTKKQKFKKVLKRVVLRLSGSKGAGVPVFVFGEQRSGTNMLMNVIKFSNEVECFDENDDEAFDNYVIRDNKRILGLINKSYGKIVVFKSISDSQNAKQLLDNFSVGKGIWIYRRYYDVVNSSLKNFKEHNTYLHYMLYEPEIAKWRRENVTEEHMALVRYYYKKGVSDASARALIWYLRNSQYFQQGLDNDDRVLLVNYEKLVMNNIVEIKRVCGFLCIDFNMKFLKDVHSKSIKKNNDPEIDQEIDRMCEKMYNKLHDAFFKLYTGEAGE